MSEFGRVGEILDKAILNNRLHHAILLYGSSVKELENIAKYAASKLLKTEQVSKHPDFFELRPEGKARFIKIGSESERTGGQWAPNTMRSLLHKLRQTPNAGGKKFALVYEADRMNIFTANAFLKTLEEPSSDTNIFLITERPNDLLDTIRSRCINLRADCKQEQIQDEQWQEWIADFADLQRNLVKGFSAEFSTSDAFMSVYSLLARFDEILSRLSEHGDEHLANSGEELDSEQLAAIEASERRALRKRMLEAIENTLLESVMEASEGKVPAMKLSRAVAELEKCTGFMELNMQDTPALEYFLLNNLRIWAR